MYKPSIGDKILAAQLDTGRKVRCIVEDIDYEPANLGSEVETQFFVCRILEPLTPDSALDIESIDNGIVRLVVGEMNPI